MNFLRLKITAILFITLSLTGIAQTLEHPVIWTTASNRDSILKKVQTYPWAADILSQLHTRIDGKLNIHQSNPRAFISTIVDLAPDDTYSESAASAGNKAHRSVLLVAAESGLLYYLTQDEKYAQFTADILEHYFDELAKRTPQKTTICGNNFYDPRSNYAYIGVAYDFIYNYLKKDGVKVYNLATNKYEAFDYAKSQKALTNIVGNALQEFGPADKYGTTSNWSVLKSPGVLFTILCIENDAERNRLIDVFWTKGSNHQRSFSKSILPMFGGQGIWPEALSYSFMPNITMILNIMDEIKPELKVFENNMHILEGNFLFDNLRNPNRSFVRYGDSKRYNDFTDDLYRYTLHVAKRKGFTAYEQQAKVALRQAYNQKGFSVKLPDAGFDNPRSFSWLLWGIDIPKTIDNNIDFQKPTVIIEHAGVALQRNYVKENNEEYGLCGIIGGGRYVHNHATGIAMELYGNGYIMGPNGGLPPSLKERQYDIHKKYFKIYAGNNTIVVNGTSSSQTSDAINIAAEPKHLEDPICDIVNFAAQSFKENNDKVDQQRTLSTIRTSATSGYYFDLYRSKSTAENKFHDYLYHNLGDATSMTSDGIPLGIKATQWYTTDKGDGNKSPGWRFFENSMASEPTSKAVDITFHLKHNNKYMHMLQPAGVERVYTKAVGPAAREAINGYVKKKSQIVAVRQTGEAWKRPYVTIFEPSAKANGTVKEVSNIYSGDQIVGAKVVSHVADKVITDLILCQENSTSIYSNTTAQLEFEGRFALVRYTTQASADTEVALYIGEGKSLKFQGETLTADASKKGFKTLSISKAINEFENLTPSIDTTFKWNNEWNGGTEPEPDTDTIAVTKQNYTIVSVENEQEPNVASNLFDGDVTDDSRWSAEVFPKSVVIDLGEEKAIIGTRVWTYQARAYQYSIELSNSPTDGFTKVVDRLTNTSTSLPITDNSESQKGRYVKLTVEGCHNYTSKWVSITELAFVFNETVGVSSIHQKRPGFDVYPNPSDSDFNIELKNINEAHVKIYNMNGKEVYNKPYVKKAISLSEGVYIIQLISDEGITFERKLVITH